MIKRGYPNNPGYSYRRNNPLYRQNIHFPINKQTPPPKKPDTISKSTKFLLIIMILIMIAAVIFIVVKGIKNNQPPEEKPLEKFNADLKISNAQMLNYTDISIKVNRNLSEENIEAIVFIFYNKTDSEITRRRVSIEKLEQVDFQIVFHFTNASRINKISIIPIFKSQSGEEVSGKVEDEYVVAENETLPEQPNNTINESNETKGELPLCTLNSRCQDNNSCTTDICSEGKCSYPLIPGCTSCEFSSECEDNNSCTANICSEGKCSYPLIPGCVPCISSSKCDDNLPCTNNLCFQGRCSYSPIEDCTPCTTPLQCEDNNACTTNFCTGNTCLYTSISGCISCTSVLQCEDNNPCTTNNCSDNKCIFFPISNCVYCTTNSQCQDNNLCTENTCVNNKCTSSQVPNCVSCTLHTQCNDNDACTTDSCSNNVCTHSPITSCTNNDGCCPNGCTSTNDNNCVQCTTANQATACNDDDVCTIDRCSNSVCSHSPITLCTSNDGCCPTGCTSLNDNNCAAVCGNGIREGTEKCDGDALGGATCAGVKGVGYTGTLKCSSTCQFDTSSCVAPCTCPPDTDICTTDICDDNEVCQHITILDCCTSSSQCEDTNACTSNICSSANKCSYPAITTCKSNDGCCPVGRGCNSINDNNCAAVCGNGYKEGSEGCDDGAKNPGDGCSSICTVESGWTCNTSVNPNVCSRNCVPSCSGKECGSNSCNTGSCGACTNAHGSNTCSNLGVCQPSCNSGWGNCDGITSNGCETALTSMSNCGSCGNSCLSGQTCTNGACVPQPGKIIKIFIIGDSTAAEYSSSRYPLTGWAMKLQQFFNNQNVIIVNNAESGASSKSYSTSSSWTNTYNSMTSGDYLFIQFGHNDEHDDADGTDPYTTYQDYLQIYIDKARTKGAYPVLLTPVERNVWSGSSLTESHGDYPDAMRALAKEQSVPLIDLTTKTRALYYSLGKVTTTNSLFMNFAAGVYSNYPSGSSDNTHFQVRGANESAKLVIEGLKELGSSSTTSALLPYTKGVTPSCTNDCTTPGPVCYSTGYRTCGNYDSDSCYEWSPVTACLSTQICTNGACVPKPTTEQADYYVATNGNNNNDGKTINTPFATWQKAFDVAQAGDLVYIRGGVYKPSGTLRGGDYYAVYVSGKSGTASNLIRIEAYPGEKPILDGTNINQNGDHIGIYMGSCSYYYIKGLIIQNFKEYGQYNGCPLGRPFILQSSTHITIDQCVVNNSGDGFSAGGSCDYLTFINCDSYNNIDFSDNGGFANGFTLTMYGAGSAAKSHTTLIGCRAWHNSDDGYDFYNKDGSYRGGYITMENCWAFDNGLYEGNGDGFKFGLSNGIKESGVQRTITNCLAFDNLFEGFDQANKIVDQVLYNNVAYNNGVWGFSYSSNPGTASCTLRNNIAYVHDLNAGVTSGYVNDHNSWNSGVTVNADDFVSLDSSQALRPRKSDGSLPDITFLHLKSGSDLINKGTDVGLPYSGSAPDLGAFEYQ